MYYVVVRITHGVTALLAKIRYDMIIGKAVLSQTTTDASK